MGGRGPAPKPDGERRRRNAAREKWTAAPGVGWQHGDVPKPPDGLLKASREVWASWFESWFSAMWKPEDLGGLRMLILLYDQVQRGEHQRAAEVRLQMDTYGITPKGQMQLRWQPPAEPDARPERKASGTYQHLKRVK